MLQFKYPTILGHLLGSLSQYAAVPSYFLSRSVHMRTESPVDAIPMPDSSGQRTVNWWRRSASAVMGKRFWEGAKENRKNFRRANVNY
jgi:hypothetical protein